MFSSSSEVLLGGRVRRHTVYRQSLPLGYDEAVELWQHSTEFRSFFIGLLRTSPFLAFRWETPPVTTDTAARTFEFVLLDSPGLARDPEPEAFREHFRAESPGVVAFENLGGDALMVVPCPRGPDCDYGHLAAFVRSAPDEQIHALWEHVGRIVQKRMSDRPLWLSTAGGGVAWLHVRLDARPKYYGHGPYRLFP